MRLPSRAQPDPPARARGGINTPRITHLDYLCRPARAREGRVAEVKPNPDAFRVPTRPRARGERLAL